MRKSVSLVLFVLVSLMAGAQQIKLSGTVSDAVNSSPLNGVTVSVLGTTFTTSTNAEGYYELLADPGTYTVEFTLPGYAKWTSVGVALVDSAGVTLNVPLKKEAAVTANKARVYGVVVDEKDNSPMEGVTIVAKGTTEGTQTDTAGKYELFLPAGAHTLEVSYVGYAKRNIPVVIVEIKDKSVDIKMSDDSKELDIVVVTGSKYEKKLGEEVVSMEVLKAQVITQSNAKIEEALNKVPGVNVLGGKTIAIRGGSGFSDATGNRVLALLDELPIISPENGGIIWDMVPIEALEQVEIIKGSTSAMYGASALSGVLNMRTVTPKKEGVNKILINYGFYDQPRQRSWNHWWHRKSIRKNGDTVDRVMHPMFGGGQFMHAKLYGDLGVVVAGAYNQDQSFRKNNDYKRARLFAKLRYIPHKNPKITTGLTLSFFHQSLKDFFLSSGIGPYTYIPGEIAITQQRTFTIDPYFNYYNEKGDKHSMKFRIFNTMYNSTTGDSTNSTQYYYDYTYSKNFKKINMVIITGSNGYYSLIKGKTFGELVADIRSIQFFTPRDIYNFSGFVQVEKKFFNKLTIAGGVSIQFAQLAGEVVENKMPLINAISKLINKNAKDIYSPVTPLFRVGLNYQATEGTYIRGSFGQGARYPALSEKYVYTVRSSAHVFPNDSLKPENGWSAEIGIKQGVKISNWMAYFDASAFILRYSDMIEFGGYDPPDSIGGQRVMVYGLPFRARNVDQARVMGIEVSTIANGKIFGVPLNFIIGYSYIDPRNLAYDPADPNSTKILKYRMQHSFKADVQSTYKGIMLGVNMFYNSFMKEVDNNTIGATYFVKEFRRTHSKGDFVMDIRTGYNYHDKFTFTFICKNVLNTEYTLRPGLIEAPRNYTFQVGYNF